MALGVFSPANLNVGTQEWPGDADEPDVLGVAFQNLAQFSLPGWWVLGTVARISHKVFLNAMLMGTVK
jgi:hypothetical protein